MIKSKYNQILIFVIFIIISLFNSHIILANTDLTDIGETANTISINKNDQDKIIEIVNTNNTENTINKEKFHNYYNNIKSNINVEEYTLKIKDKILLPADSSLFFKEMEFKNIEFENARLLTKNVTNMNSMFKQILANPDVSDFEVSKVTDFGSMFEEAINATPNTSSWNTMSAMDMSNMFASATLANPDVSSWDVSNVENFAAMFYNTKNATPNTIDWKTISATNMSNMFDNATMANPDVSGWDVSNVENFASMFQSAKNATPNTSSWITSSAIYMTSMFADATMANPDVSSWDVSHVQSFLSMFYGATAANPNIDNWEFNEALEIDTMFHNNPLISPNILVNKQFPKLESMTFFYFSDENKNENVYVDTVPYLTNITNINDLLDSFPAFGFISLLDMENITIDFKKPFIKRVVVKNNKYVIKEKTSGNEIAKFTYNDKIPDEVYNQLQDDTVYVLETDISIDYNLKIDEFDYLTDNQKMELKKEITNANNDTVKQAIVDKANSLNEAMKELDKNYKSLVIDNTKIATNDSLSKYNEVREEVKNILASTSDLNKKNINDLDIKYRDIYNSIVYIDKTAVKKKIEDLDTLTDEQKNALYIEVDNAADENAINNVISKATELNNSMKALQELNKTNIKTSGVSDEVITSYNEVKEEVNTALSSSNDIDKNNIDALKDKLQEEINKVNENRLSNKKVEAKREIALLNNLTDKEKTTYNNEVDVADTETKIDEIVSNAKAKDLSNLNNEKNRISGLIDNLEYLNDKQKEALKNELVPINIKTELEPIFTKANELNEEMKKLDIAKTTVEQFIDSNDYSKLKKVKQDELKENLEKAKLLLNKVSGENKNKEEVIELIKKLVIPTKKDLTPYISKVKALYFNKTDVVYNFDKGVYANVELASPVVDIIKNIDNVEIPKIIGGIQTGFNVDIVPNIKLGLFTEYYNQKANHISVGINYKAPYTIGFIRYRLASIFNENIYNHNVDIYTSGEYEYKIKDNLNIKPSLGIYMSYSAPTKLDEDVILENNIMTSLDLKTNLNYIKNRLKLYTEVELKLVLGQNQIIKQEDENYNNELEINNDMIQGYLKIGLEKEFSNNMVIGSSLLFDKALRFNLNVGYNF